MQQTTSEGVIDGEISFAQRPNANHAKYISITHMDRDTIQLVRERGYPIERAS